MAGATFGAGVLFFTENRHPVERQAACYCIEEYRTTSRHKMQKRVLSYPELRGRKGIVWSRAWLEEEIDRWLDGRAAQRDNPQ
jgi:hypothetical protein